MLRTYLAKTDWVYNANLEYWIRYIDDQVYAIVELKGGIYFYEEVLEDESRLTSTFFEEVDLLHFLENEIDNHGSVVL